MPMARNLNGRLRRLEAMTKQSGDEVYMVWGADDAAIDAGIADAAARGEVRLGDPVMWAIWPGPGDMPANHWTTMDDLSDGEVVALLAFVRSILRQKGEQPQIGPRSAERMTENAVFRAMAVEFGAARAPAFAAREPTA